MKIFIAHSLGKSDKALEYAKNLESMGHETYVPIRDTPEKDGTPEIILKCNLDGIKWSDEVHVIWDGVSHGTLFDLGSAYGLDKPIKVVSLSMRCWYSYLRENIGSYLEMYK